MSSGSKVVRLHAAQARSRLHAAAHDAETQIDPSGVERRECAPQTSHAPRFPWLLAQASDPQRRAVRTEKIVRPPHVGQRSRRGDAEQASFQHPREDPESGSDQRRHVRHGPKRPPAGHVGLVQWTTSGVGPDTSALWQPEQRV